MCTLELQEVYRGWNKQLCNCSKQGACIASLHKNTRVTWLNKMYRGWFVWIEGWHPFFCNFAMVVKQTCTRNVQGWSAWSKPIFPDPKTKQIDKASKLDKRNAASPKFKLL